jgi:hypothetical protein
MEMVGITGCSKVKDESEEKLKKCGSVLQLAFRVSRFLIAGFQN